MVRRIGFGDSGSHKRGEPPEPAGRVEHSTDGAAGQPSEKVPPVVPREPWVRFVLAGFIALWLGIWTWGIWYVFGQIGGEWDLWGKDDFDWIGFGFLAIWLFFALIGWAFGTVILVVMLFGKPVTPERRAEKEARRAERRAAREARRTGKGR